MGIKSKHVIETIDKMKQFNEEAMRDIEKVTGTPETYDEMCDRQLRNSRSDLTTMTRRDMFAMAAMQVLLAGREAWNHEDVSKRAFAIADAMEEARNKS